MRTVERGSAVATAAKRVEELLDLTLPLDVHVRFQFGSPGDPNSPETHLTLSGTGRCGNDVREDAEGLAILREFVLAALDQRIPVRPGGLGGCNSLNADSPREAFQCAFAYLRTRGVSELTLAPVERIVAEALAASGAERPVPPASPPRR